MNGRIFIQAMGQRRRAIWLRIFDNDVLPILAGRPRMDVDAVTLRPVAVYELALRRLDEWQICRLAAYMARRTRRPYTDVLDELMIRPSFPIRSGEDVRVIEPEADAPPPAFALTHTLRPAPAGLF